MESLILEVLYVTGNDCTDFFQEGINTRYLETVAFLSRHGVFSKTVTFIRLRQSMTSMPTFFGEHLAQKSLMCPSCKKKIMKQLKPRSKKLEEASD